MAPDAPHPIATPEQHEHERQALALTRHPIVQEAYQRVRKAWLEAADPGPDMRARFDEDTWLARPELHFLFTDRCHLNAVGADVAAAAVARELASRL